MLHTIYYLGSNFAFYRTIRIFPFDFWASKQKKTRLTETDGTGIGTIVGAVGHADLRERRVVTEQHGGGGDGRDAASAGARRRVAATAAAAAAAAAAAGLRHRVGGDGRCGGRHSAVVVVADGGVGGVGRRLRRGVRVRCRRRVVDAIVPIRVAMVTDLPRNTENALQPASSGIKESNWAENTVYHSMIPAYCSLNFGSNLLLVLGSSSLLPICHYDHKYSTPVKWLSMRSK